MTTTIKTSEQVRAELTQLVRHGWPIFRAWLLEQSDAFRLSNAHHCPTAKWLRSRGYNVDMVYYDCVVANGLAVNTNVPIVNGRLVNYHDCAASLPQHAPVTGARLVEMIEDYASRQDYAPEGAMAEFWAYHNQLLGARTMTQSPEDTVGETVREQNARPIDEQGQTPLERTARAIREALEAAVAATIGDAVDLVQADVRSKVDEAVEDYIGDLDPDVSNAVDSAVDQAIRDYDFYDNDAIDSAVGDAVEQAVGDLDLSDNSHINDAVDSAIDEVIGNVDLVSKIEEEMENVDVEDKVRDAVRSALRSLSEDL